LAEGSQHRPVFVTDGSRRHLVRIGVASAILMGGVWCAALAAGALDEHGLPKLALPSLGGHAASTANQPRSAARERSGDGTAGVGASGASGRQTSRLATPLPASEGHGRERVNRGAANPKAKRPSGGRVPGATARPASGPSQGTLRTGTTTAPTSTQPLPLPSGAPTVDPSAPGEVIGGASPGGIPQAPVGTGS
jgi:hypothetical protein